MGRLVFILVFILQFNCNSDKQIPDDFYLFVGTELEEFAKFTRVEDTISMARLFEQEKIDLETVELKYGNTILSIAVQNSKEKAVKRILELGANPNCINKSGNSPLLELQYLSESKTVTLDMCKDLVKYGADVNKIKFEVDGNDTLSAQVPLEGLTRFSEIAKYLVTNGANVYFEFDNRYNVWFFKKVRQDDSTIEFIYWLVMQQNQLPPAILGFTKPDNNPINFQRILDALKKRASLSELEKIKLIEHRVNPKS